MSLGATLGNVFSPDRQRARYESERVNGEEREPGTTVSASAESETATGGSSTSGADVESGAAAAPADSQTSSRRSATNNPRNSRRNARTENGTENPTEEDEEDDESLAEEPFSAEGESTGGRLFAVRENTMTLAELEEQRELSRRRSSACVLLAVFVLFRLWVECLQTQDPTLLLLCLLGTSWTARWIRYNREREEELDRRIENYLQRNNNTNEVDRNEYARLSFQAQLTLAIMESQRHMMEGGYGRPDGLQDQSPGVSDEGKAKWKKFHWKQVPDKKGDYGALPKGDDSEMDNHCSICLGEYEDAEDLTQLPCQHVYHDECILSWTSNHTKCPLCNMDLESVVGGNESIV